MEKYGVRPEFINLEITETATMGAKKIALENMRKLIEYGVSFSALVADKRLASAEMLLKNTDFTIAKIASETFPGTESYFYTCFKKKFGMSPLQYRKASKG